jgi:hypothetical protein
MEHRFSDVHGCQRMSFLRNGLPGGILVWFAGVRSWAGTMDSSPRLANHGKRRGGRWFGTAYLGMTSVLPPPDSGVLIERYSDYDGDCVEQLGLS